MGSLLSFIPFSFISRLYHNRSCTLPSLHPQVPQRRTIHSMLPLPLALPPKLLWWLVWRHWSHRLLLLPLPNSASDWIGGAIGVGSCAFDSLSHYCHASTTIIIAIARSSIKSSIRSSSIASSTGSRSSASCSRSCDSNNTFPTVSSSERYYSIFDRDEEILVLTDGMILCIACVHSRRAKPSSPVITSKDTSSFSCSSYIYPNRIRLFNLTSYF